MASDIGAKIDAANKKAMDIIVNAQPTWVDMQRAKDFIPGFKDNMVLFAGPPMDVKEALPPVRTAICGGAVHEGLAKNLDEAWKMILAGEIEVKPALDFKGAGGANSPVTASSWVHVAADSVTGVKACCVIQEGPFNEALRWGMYTPTVEARLKWFDDVFGPVLQKLIRAMGGINLRNIVARATGMGDENHSRQVASNAMTQLMMYPYLMDLDIDHKTRTDVVKFLAAAERFFLHLFIAGSAAVMEAAKGIDYSTVMVAMGGNGTNFGMKFSGTGDQWFVTKAPKALGMVINPTFTEDQICPYIGDSCAVEVYGFGGMAAVAGPMVVRLAGGDFNEAMRRTREAGEVSLGRHDWAPIPWMDFQGPPVGVEIRKVLATGITPTSHGGTTHINGGQAGAGSCNLPMDCFKQGLQGFAKKYGV